MCAEGQLYNEKKDYVQHEGVREKARNTGREPAEHCVCASYSVHSIGSFGRNTTAVIHDGIRPCLQTARGCKL